MQDEPYSPSRSVSPPNSTLPTLANIVIPSNLQDILASIKNVPTAASVKEEIFPSKNVSTQNYSIQSTQPPIISSQTSSSADEEYNPISTSSSAMYTALYEPGKSFDDSQSSNPPTNSGSKLAKLSDAELMSMVPDDALLFPPEPTKNARNVENVKQTKGTFDDFEPPPPGLEDEYMPV